ncbi:carbohydrate kinase family protein [Paracoccus fistulariae]|uniref:Carbohydrate kinase n=1 Tax=Paracoccus fistulariae TaxID=658446 RepID=A0ABY7SQ16_9RHOB|nr:carbohydrate kinase [Paracoccus fistulariae]MDB6180062.1 carbohydrate kinase [Paracoccus fistulariae]WCR08151.1 carbohydrate kinase [Paracoccus fistulariae]
MILCAGESLIDMVPQDGSFTPHLGGAVFNTTVALGRLGRPTGYLWPLSRDPFGEQLSQRLREAGVSIDLCPRTHRLTTLALVTLDDGNARYSFYDEGSAGRLFAQEDLPSLPAGVEALFVGGISLVPDPCGGTIEKLIQQNHADLPVMMDPNIRPFFVNDPEAFRARLDRLLAMVDIVKLSSDDIEWLFPDLSPEQAAQSLLTSGPKLVLHTAGEHGATAYWSGEPVNVKSMRSTVVDTIGAGDTFNAGFLAGLHQQGALSKQGLDSIDADIIGNALKTAVQAAAIVVSRAGANPPWAHEMPKAD